MTDAGAAQGRVLVGAGPAERLAGRGTTPTNAGEADARTIREVSGTELERLENDHD
jgi:hypothetical protein